MAANRIYYCQVRGCNPYLATVRKGHSTRPLIYMCRRHAKAFDGHTLLTQQWIIETANPSRWETTWKTFHVYDKDYGDD